MNPIRSPRLFFSVPAVCSVVNLIFGPVTSRRFHLGEFASHRSFTTKTFEKMAEYLI